MRYVVVGASGRTGGLLVEQLIAAKHSVVATIRSAKAMAPLVKLGAETAMLDLRDSPLDQFANAFTKADAIIFAAGSAVGESSEIDRIGVRRTLNEAKKAGVRRYVAISSIGASTGMSTRGMGAEMQDYYKQKRAAGKLIRDSGLDWTILEPAELTDGKPAGRVEMSVFALPNAAVARADVASVAVAVLGEPRSIGRALQITGGKTPIAEALKAAVK